MKMIHRGEKGFTLIELLVVIAILGIIAAVVALNVAGFFGRGTLQAANTELHQAQTAIISAMAEAESNVLVGVAEGETVSWDGSPDVIKIQVAGLGDPIDASEFVYGPFRAAYTVDHRGAIIWGYCDYEGGWGPNIGFHPTFLNWTDDDDHTPSTEAP